MVVRTFERRGKKKKTAFVKSVLCATLWPVFDTTHQHESSTANDYFIIARV